MDDPVQPTLHLPGSPGKIDVLRQRAALGLPLFHNGDAVDYSICRIYKKNGRIRSVTVSKIAAVAEGLRLGKTYRQMAKELGCYYTYVADLAKLARAAF